MTSVIITYTELYSFKSRTFLAVQTFDSLTLFYIGMMALVGMDELQSVCVIKRHQAKTFLYIVLFQFLELTPQCGEQIHKSCTLPF